MNIAIISGRLVKDPEARTTQGGISQSTFDIAVQRRFKNSEGKHDADFLTVVAWRQTADFCNKYLTKGRAVAVVGSIQKRSYSAQDGSKRYVTEIIADNVDVLDSSKKAEPDAPHEFVEVEDADLPFD